MNDAMNAVFATLELERSGAPAFGTITRAAIETDVFDLSATDTLLRVVNLSARPRKPATATFGEGVWSGILAAARAIADPTPKVAQLLRHAAHERAWLIVEPNKQVRLVAPSSVRETVAAWELFPSQPDSNDVFLLELAGAVESDMEDLLARMHQALVITTAPATIHTSVSGPTVLITDSVLPLTPEQAAIARRDALLARARSEEWPESGVVGQQLGSSNEEAGRQRATRDRAAGRLFGVRPPGERTFLHPRFQFLPDGRVHSKLPDLLAALATNPELTEATDPAGWGRLGWLYQPRRSLSVRSLAEERAPDGVADDSLDDRGRTPAEVFPTDPQAVVALAIEDAEVVSGRR
ncbi:hypothetical protein IMW82_14535 [Rhodanobacter sp. B2A1Ga4]|uniref:hypothetical protein n=1 Tax=Rhodanobacter sp. B2A1Ga4 TaxID=2778647 RepID=UPI001B37771D|nr:hypothetical protein [Rhodanobacter sp. B2A1Ga4]MBQ4855884.1 hypothetical protein [Rhodanobacter sp. B2A1Ga4]